MPRERKPINPPDRYYKTLFLADEGVIDTYTVYQFNNDSLTYLKPF